MKKLSLLAFLCVFLFLTAPVKAANPRVLVQTNFGDITIELNKDKAPITVENFLHYVRTGFYRGLIFHRVISGFVIQGGGYFVYDANFYAMPTYPEIINESYNNLSNLRGTIAMARTDEPDSASSQFYINLVNNTELDKTATEVGYCVFGTVTAGMNVVDAIAQTPVINNIPHPTMVIISDVKIITPGCWINGDINNNGIANLKDYAIFAANWKKTGSNLSGDLNTSNVVDFYDLKLFADDWLEMASWYKQIAEDINNDGIVNFKDFAIIGNNWLQLGTELSGDLNNDWCIDFLDLSVLSDHWLEEI